MKDWWVVFRAWKDASLLRRTVVTVAAFVMMSSLSIAVMSAGAVAATHAVFQPPTSSSAAPKGSASAGAPSDAPPHAGKAEASDDEDAPTRPTPVGKPSLSSPFAKKGGSHAKRTPSSDGEKPGADE